MYKINTFSLLECIRNLVSDIIIHKQQVRKEITKKAQIIWRFALFLCIFVDGKRLIQITNLIYKISYTTTPNASCVMQYDDGLDIDLDDWEMLYYIGLLGKGTTHLPQAYNKQKSSSKSSAGSNEWSVDDKGRAVKLVNTQWKLEDGHEYDRTVREYYWEW